MSEYRICLRCRFTDYKEEFVNGICPRCGNASEPADY